MATAARRFKDAVYDELARISKAVASPRRLELIDLLAQGGRTVEALSRETGQSIANTSQHLQVLRAARLVEAEKRGVFVRYRLASDQVADFFRTLRILAETQVEELRRIAQAFVERRGPVEAVDQEDLLARVMRGEVTVIDVRPAEEFAAGHIPGARSIPLPQLERRLAELPRKGTIVAYCRGPYCVLAIEAVARLRSHGFHALRLEAGIPDWRAQGLPVERGEAPPAPAPRCAMEGTG
ncbi:MAG: ArsR/SmtB family transcription factor [Gemmatimonadota bacterium]